MKIALKGLDLWGEKMLDFLAPKRACFTQRAVFREEEALKFGNTPVKKISWNVYLELTKRINKDMCVETFDKHTSFRAFFSISTPN